MAMTQKKRIEFLKKMLSTDPRWARKAMFRILENQMPDEKNGAVIYSNGMGFSKFDAGIITSFIERLQQNLTLTPKQTMTMLKIMPKYAEQLLKTKTDVEKLDRMIEESEYVGM